MRSPMTKRLAVLVIAAGIALGATGAPPTSAATCNQSRAGHHHHHHHPGHCWGCGGCW